MNSIQMSMDGFMDIVGTTWYSKYNANHFTVKDVMNDGSQWIINTTDGRMITLTEMDQYIQSDTPVHNMPKVNPHMGKINPKALEGLEEEVMVDGLANDPDDGLLPEDRAALGLTTGLSVTAPINTPAKPQNYDIIDKAMSKVKSPRCVCNIVWDEYPSRELELLQDIMDIPAKDIADYIYTKYFTGDIQTQIINQIKLDLGIDAD